MTASPPDLTPPDLTPPDLTRVEQAALARRRRGRNIAMLVVLVGVALLFYAIAMVKLSQHGMGG